MALSSGARQAMGLAAGWAVAAGCAAVSVLYSTEIRSMAGSVLGVAPAAIEEMARQERSRDQAKQARATTGRRIVELKAGSHGHYNTGAEIDGRSIDVMVDTGASIVALTFEDARRAGLHVRDSDFTQPVSTANGIARFAPIMLDRVSIGDITVRNVPAAVSEPGKLGVSLLGMSFLSRLQRVDMRNGVLILQE